MNNEKKRIFMESEEEREDYRLFVRGQMEIMYISILNAAIKGCCLDGRVSIEDENLMLYIYDEEKPCDKVELCKVGDILSINLTTTRDGNLEELTVRTYYKEIIIDDVGYEIVNL